MILTNIHNLPSGFVKSIENKLHNKPNSLSATTLLKGTKEIILTERHWSEIKKDVAEFIWSTFGTAFHSIMEKGTDTDKELAEYQVEYKVDGINITGTIDNYCEETGVISDYKTASINKIKFKSFDDWKKQGLIYAWLLKKNNKPVSKCRFLGFLKDWSVMDSLKDPTLPNVPLSIYEFNVTEDDLAEIEKFIREKIEMYKTSLLLHDNEIKRCSDIEIWRTPTVYAITKKGAKRCVTGGKFENKQEADKALLNYDNNHYIDVREGQCKKCLGYCDCKEFCSFYKSEVKGA